MNAQTPFTPAGVQHSWDNTSLTWFMDCPRKYYYAMIEGWRSKETSPHLTFGLEYHRALERFDVLRASGYGHEAALHEVTRETLERTHDFASDHRTKNRVSLLRSIIWYLDEFADDSAQTVILADGRPAVELSFRIPLGDYTLDNQPVLWCGHLDRVVNFNGDTFVTDRKTTSMAVSSYYFDGYELDRQMTGYTYMGQVALAAPIRGVIIDAAQVQPEYTKFARGITYRTPARLEEWIENTWYWITQAAQLAKGFGGEASYPMNETSCTKHRSNDATAGAHGCIFRDICSKSPGVRQRFLETEFQREPWNPLSTR